MGKRIGKSCDALKFKCGIRMVLIVKVDKVGEAKSLLNQTGDVMYDLRKLVKEDGKQAVIKVLL